MQLTGDRLDPYHFSELKTDATEQNNFYHMRFLLLTFLELRCLHNLLRLLFGRTLSAAFGAQSRASADVLTAKIFEFHNCKSF